MYRGVYCNSTRLLLVATPSSSSMDSNTIRNIILQSSRVSTSSRQLSMPDQTSRQNSFKPRSRGKACPAHRRRRPPTVLAITFTDSMRMHKAILNACIMMYVLQSSRQYSMHNIMHIMHTRTAHPYHNMHTEYYYQLVVVGCMHTIYIYISQYA